VPIGLKDLYGVAGKPLTASSRVLDQVPERHCDPWARLEAAGMVLLGHLHTHEFAVGGTTDQVGNPWALDRSSGGSSGGSAAALAARTTPAATGTDTAGSLRIPSAITGTSAVKPTRGAVPLRGLVPLAPTLDHAGPMARTVADCEPLLAALAGTAPPSERRPLRRVALSPRLPLVELDQQMEVTQGPSPLQVGSRDTRHPLSDVSHNQLVMAILSDFIGKTMAAERNSAGFAGCGRQSQDASAALR
jgi:aspartyl-tRNA(Asn)/glutamyl-tRNA(Gln) amidotransferase subunit A